MGGLEGLLAGSAVLVVAATPAALVLALSDAVAGFVTGLRLRSRPFAAEA